MRSAENDKLRLEKALEPLPPSVEAVKKFTGGPMIRTDIRGKDRNPKRSMSV